MPRHARLFAPNYRDVNVPEEYGSRDEYVRSEFGIGDPDVEIHYESGRSVMLGASDEDPVLELRDNGFSIGTHYGDETVKEVVKKVGL